ncbi:MAG: hypothetical protein HQM08_26325 [Candidatus Riflebacteria bacterium]|nr:hypothetical protein [Candidatus Riflebacteria bacterium]
MNWRHRRLNCHELGPRLNCGNFKAAMSLLEIVVSVFIFGLCLLPIFELLGKSRQIARVTQEEITASNLAVELVDQICCMPFDQIPIMNEIPLKNDGNGYRLLQGKVATELILSPLPEGYDRTLTIESISQCIKLVKAEVGWGNNPHRNSSIECLLEWTP